MTATRAKEVAEFAVLAAEAAGRVVALEAAHAADPALDAAVVRKRPAKAAAIA